jgi:hypothetical protein
LTPAAPLPSATSQSRPDGGADLSIIADEADRAVLLSRLFVEALNARDVEGLAGIVSEEVEFRNAFGGRTLRGREAVERIVRAATDARLSLVRTGAEEVTRAGGVARVRVPVLELVGGAEIEGQATFEVREGRITAFEVTSELLAR